MMAISRSLFTQFFNKSLSRVPLLSIILFAKTKQYFKVSAFKSPSFFLIYDKNISFHPLINNNIGDRFLVWFPVFCILQTALQI